MDTQQKVTKVMELAGKISQLEKELAARKEEMLGLLTPKAADSQKVRKVVKRKVPSRKGRTRENPKYPTPKGVTREQQLHDWLTLFGPATFAQIDGAKFIPTGSIHYFLRRLIDAKQVTFDGSQYAIAKAGV